MNDENATISIVTEVFFIFTKSYNLGMVRNADLSLVRIHTL